MAKDLARMVELALAEEGSLTQGLLIPDHRHPGTRHFAPLFATAHLPAPAASTSRPFAALAQACIDALEDGPELTACLRKLLEAKDCAVRAWLFPGT